MGKVKQIKVGAFLSYVAIVVNIVAGLFYTPWMIAKIGQSQYGLYTLANSLITLFLVDFGLSSATARYLSKYNAEGNKEAAESVLGAIYKLYLIVDAVILVVLTVIFFLIDTIYVKLTPVELEQFKVVYVISALFSVVNFPFVTFNGILTAYEKFVPLKLIDIAYRVFNVGFTVVALLLGGGLYALVTVHVLVGFLVLVVKFITIKVTIPIKVNFRTTDRTLYKSLFGFSLWVTITALAQRLIFNITPSILGVVANTAAIAVFGVIVTIEGYTYTITTAINGMFLPKISRLVAKDKSREELSSLLLSVGKFQYALNGLIVTGFAVVGKTFIHLWVGSDYAMAYWGILLVIVPGLFFNSLQIANTTLVVENKVKIQALISIMAGVVNVMLSIPLSMFYGVLGACISIFIAYMLRAIAINIVSYRILKLNIPALIRSCYLRMSIPIVISIGGGIGIGYMLPQQTWFFFIIKAAIIVMIYLVTAFLIGFKKKDWQYIKKAFE
ncbi:MAG: oligosaccharide flippase family protein [Clostridia bacterium]|nr:oligosaccharide flippase family protein [Clostridia bacterium]